MMALYASFAAPRLAVLEAPAFVLDLNGRTSGGKTTTLRVAASPWGAPTVEAEGRAGVIRSWDMSRVAPERILTLLRHVPVFLDESQLVKDEKAISNFVYLACNLQGRERASKVGLQATGSFRTVVLSTGEAALTSFSEAGGTRARVLSYSGSPFTVGTDHEQLVEAVMAGWPHHRSVAVT